MLGAFGYATSPGTRQRFAASQAARGYTVPRHLSSSNTYQPVTLTVGRRSLPPLRSRKGRERKLKSSRQAQWRLAVSTASSVDGEGEYAGEEPGARASQARRDCSQPRDKYKVQLVAGPIP